MNKSAQGEGETAQSVEEADALARSRKKVRTGDAVVVYGRPVVPREEEWMTDDTGPMESETPRKSYREACANTDGLSSEDEEEEGWWFDEGWRRRLKVENTNRGPNVIVLPEFKKKLARKWRLTLFVRLLGRMVREDYLGMKLQQIWGHNGDVETLEFGAGYFIVNFKHQDDYEFALTGGPWLILDHYLAVQPWKPDFDPIEEEVSKIAAWVRIPQFPLDYYDLGVLYVVGNQIGRVLRVDRNTEHRSKARFARLCVELDLQKPLLPAILINGKEKKIVYEGLHLICFGCGKYGHDQDHCPSRPDESCGQGKDSRNTGAKPTTAPSYPEREKGTPYGGWMVQASRRNQRRQFRFPNRRSPDNQEVQGAENQGNSNQGGMGSRFSALSTEEDNVSQNENHVRMLGNQMHDTTNDLKAKNKGSKSRGIPVGPKSRAISGIAPKEKDTGRNKAKVSPMEEYTRVRAQVDLSKENIRSMASSSLALVPVMSDISKVHATHMETKSHAIIPYQEIASSSVNPVASNPIDPGAEAGEGCIIRSNLLLEGGTEDTVVLDAATGEANKEIVDTRGFGGGIWVFWSDSFEFSVDYKTEYFMHGTVNRGKNDEWALTIVYGDPRYCKRHFLWQGLQDLTRVISGHWVVAGDFNATLLQEDRQTPTGRYVPPETAFRRWVMASDMRDIGFSGPKFTWHRGASASRIDRVLVNYQ
ncbi:uncharacterized protein LOC114734506 [Neltuma alba]|uniref:uncharacterized protein LOC114734506 n=1 Tax=Neltuma alba TaxID=207710 RepID=UPI0010A45D97|nr:uncharacterized protein LOC114734506 [Prosopis alba]